MQPAHLILIFGLAVAAPLHAADNPVTAVQRSLTDLGFLYAESSGTIDEETRSALRRFQIRTGLKPTGEIDTETLQALAKATASPPGEGGSDRGQPSLRERALQKDISDREFLARIEDSDRVEASPPTPATPISPPAIEAPPQPRPQTVAPSADPAESRERSIDQLAPERAASFVQSYLKAAEAQRPDEELSFYADHVDYFDSGRVSRKFVAQDQANYYRRWPNREFNLEGTPQLVSNNGKRTVVRFRMRYKLSNARERASGATENVVQLQQENGGFKIVGIQERKVRE